MITTTTVYTIDVNYFKTFKNDNKGNFVGKKRALTKCISRISPHFLAKHEKCLFGARDVCSKRARGFHVRDGISLVCELRGRLTTSQRYRE